MTAIASDHGGFALKQRIKEYLKQRDLPYTDYGTFTTESVDYPDYAYLAADAIINGVCERGIFICTTGIGISIAANRKPGIRAAVCTDPYQAFMTRSHNSANVLCLGQAVVGEGLALEIVKTFLDTPFSEEEKHARRVNKLG